MKPLCGFGTCSTTRGRLSPWRKEKRGRTSRRIASLKLALVRLLEIIGEAASRVPKEERALYPTLPWVQLVGLRNRLIHGYDTVDLDIL